LQPGRPGFTLVELIVVIAIIAILAALTTGAVMRYYSVQQQTNTETVIRKVYGAFERQWQAVIDKASNEKLPPDGPPPSDPTYPYSMRGVYETQILPMATGNDPTDPNIPFRARVIWIKARLRQEFPTNYSEIIFASRPLYAVFFGPPPANWQPLPLGALPALQVYVNGLSAPIQAGFTPGKAPTPAENSACLLMSLTLVNRGGINLSADDLGAQAVADTDKDGLNEIIDGWRVPMMFFRWPVGNFELGALNPATPGSRESTFADPQDPNGLLVTPPPYSTYPNVINTAWWVSQSRNKFEWLLHSVSVPNSTPVVPPQPPWPPFPKEYYMIPVIASAGPNKNFGLYPAFDTSGQSPYPKPLWPNPMLPIPPIDTTNYGPGYGMSGDDSDNIYSYRLRLGARGD
jgi:prepilin-type N-terminal cleavage/methylation domain-containing protein